jgi:hypothetical protein
MKILVEVCTLFLVIPHIQIIMFDHSLSFKKIVQILVFVAINFCFALFI